jgi:hypothetical protein
MEGLLRLHDQHRRGEELRGDDHDRLNSAFC